MANYRMTGMPAKRPTPAMPAPAGIHLSRAENWIPALAGMTAGERVDRFDAARREAMGLAAGAEVMAALEQTERALEGKGRGKKK